MGRREFHTPPVLPGVYRLKKSTDSMTHWIVADISDPRRKGARLRKGMLVAAPSDAEAFVALQDLKRRLLADDVAPEERATLRTLMLSCLKLHGPTVDVGTAERLAFEMKMIDGVLGDFWTDALAVPDVQAAALSLCDRYARGTVMRMLATLRFVVSRNRRRFSEDFHRDLIVGRAIRLPMPPYEGEPDGYTPGIRLVRAFLAYAREHYPNFYLWMDWKVTWGIRGAHLSALKLDDVDRDRMVVRVRRKVYRGRLGRVSERKPAPKSLPITEEMLADFDEHMRRMVGKVDNPSAWLFPGRNGLPMRGKEVGRAWADCCRSVGIDAARWKPHGARGSFYDILRAGGEVDVDMARTVTAHTARMADQYATVGEDDRREVVRIMRAELRPVPNTAPAPEKEKAD